MRLIDADALYEKTAEWEAQAFAYIEVLNRTPLEEMTVEERAEWRRWTAISGERSAFKHDIADAPTIEAEPVKHGRWIEYDNSHCECPFCHSEWSYFSNDTERFDYCPNCGADMRGGENG